MFLDLMNWNPTVQPLFDKWPQNHCPFNAILVFPDKVFREKYRSRLIQANIYPSVHWVLNGIGSADSVLLSDRIMTIPVDQRYGDDDIRRIAVAILSEQ